MERTIFLPHADYRFLKALWPFIINTIQSKVYYDFFKDKPCSSNFWMKFTVENYYFSFIYKWCQLFGTYNEPLHYTKLMTKNFLIERLASIEIKSKKDLRTELLKEANLTETEHKKSHEQMLIARNRYLIHQEHDPNEINNGDVVLPKTETPLKLAIGLYSLLIKLLNNCSTIKEKDYFSIKTTFDILSIEELINTIRNDIPKF